MIIEKNTTLEEDEFFMSIPTILQGYNDSSLTQKSDCLKYDTPIIDL